MLLLFAAWAIPWKKFALGFFVMHAFCNVFASVSMVCLCFTVLFDGVALEDVRAAISFICFLFFWRGGISQSPMVLHVAVCLDLRLRFLKNAAACLRLLLCDYCGFFDRSQSFHEFFPLLLLLFRWTFPRRLLALVACNATWFMGNCFGFVTFHSQGFDGGFEHALWLNSGPFQ